MKDREGVVGVGILGFFGFVVLAYYAPGVVAELLMAFSVVAFVFGVSACSSRHGRGCRTEQPQCGPGPCR